MVVDTSLPNTPRDKGLRRSAVRPLSTRFRASVRDREIEETLCKEVAEFHSPEDDEGYKVLPAVPSERTPPGVAARTAAPLPGLLPEQPRDMAVLIVVGAVLFKVLEGRSVEIPVDVLVAAGVACGLLGYQLGQPKAPSAAAPVSPQGPNDSEQSEMTATEGVTALPHERPSFHKQQSLRLLRQSMSRLMIEPANTESSRPVPVPATTFAKFPNGAAIGESISCQLLQVDGLVPT